MSRTRSRAACKGAQARRPWRQGSSGRLAGETQVVLVLQGGGALGAYQAGVYEALHEAGVEPDWVIGTSIGAINAALIVGNPRERRVGRLREFWSRMSQGATPAHAPSLPGMPAFWTAFGALWRGVPGFFVPHQPAWFGPHVRLGEDAAGYYRTSPLRETLDGLLDVARLAAGPPRLTVGAVQVRTGRMRYFDSRKEALDLRHVMASGALPPAFPPVRIDNELYWDGGIYSNTPVEAVFDDKPRRDALVFAVQLWRPEGDPPQTMWQVGGRMKDVQFASRVDSHVDRQAQIHTLRHVVRELARELPAETLARPEVREMVTYGCSTVMHLMRLVVPRLPGEDHTKDLDFDAARVRLRWQAGIDDACRMLQRRPWLEPVGAMDGLVIHDLRG